MFRALALRQSDWRTQAHSTQTDQNSRYKNQSQVETCGKRVHRVNETISALNSRKFERKMTKL